MSENGHGEDSDPLAGRLAECRPFLREEYESIDPRLPGLLKMMRSRGLGECWHKNATFYEHLLRTYRMLKLWGCSDTISLAALMHSAYTDSPDRLAIFAPGEDRSVLRDLIGEDAEELVYLLTTASRREVIFERNLDRVTDDELLAGLKQWDDPTDEQKKKKKLFVPEEGIVVKHMHTGEDVVLPRRVVAFFLLFTIADFGEQLFDWQDILSGNEDGKFEYKGPNHAGWHAPWPGTCKPGLWLTAASRMGVLLNILLHEDAAQQGELQHRFKDLEILLPEFFNKCTQILSPLNQSRSRDQYWEAMHIVGARERLVSTAVPLLRSACELNPFVAEPHLLLAHIYLTEGEYELAESEASEGVKLLLDWVTPWDKRMTWEAWLSFARIMRDHAVQRTWPRSSFGVIALGLVK